MPQIAGKCFPVTKRNLNRNLNANLNNSATSEPPSDIGFLPGNGNHWEQNAQFLARRDTATVFGAARAGCFLTETHCTRIGDLATKEGDKRMNTRGRRYTILKQITKDWYTKFVTLSETKRLSSSGAIPHLSFSSDLAFSVILRPQAEESLSQPPLEKRFFAFAARRLRMTCLRGCGGKCANVRWADLVLLLGVAVLLSACSTTVNWNYQRTPSTAFAQPETTTIGALFQEAADQHPGLSGFSLLVQGQNAFIARLAMADLAEKTLDAQYYIWDGDTTGRILANRLMRAADRGVRVRVLVDDNYQTTEKDFMVAALDAHPNVEMRVFNPVTNRALRALSFLGDFGRVNHRMHNKLFVMDNAVGIAGGRNIADIYFGVRADHNYRDLDVVTAGPIVREMSASFDLFWNSEWAVPIGATVTALPTEQDLRAHMQRQEENIAAAGSPYPIDQDLNELRARLVRIRDNFIWAPGRVLVDDPSKVTTAADSGVIAEALVQRTVEVKDELLIESAYFVLRERALGLVQQLHARGAKVRVLTNSALSNDVAVAHAGYANTRKPLLKAGAELYELRPDSSMERRWSLVAGKSEAALHTKAVVFDRKAVFIGSYNLDPRSAALNTEVGVMIESAEIAGQVGELMDGGVTAGSAYHVTLDTDGDLVWTTENEGKTVKYDKDPGTSFWQRFVIGVVRLLPIESQL
jgi:putative cardiolipin synthase